MKNEVIMIDSSDSEDGTSTNDEVGQENNLKRKAPSNGLNDGKGPHVERGSASECNIDFSGELKKAGFSLFRPLVDYRCFGWNPNDALSSKGDDHKYKSLASVASAEEILRYLELDGRPSRIESRENIQRYVPRSFEEIDTPPKVDLNRFPFGCIGVASLHVASRRGVDLKTVDFCFGGSTLNMLASKGSKKGSSVFVATKIYGTQCIFISNKSSRGPKDLSNIGFQFERLVTGGNMADVSCIKTTEHIHTMKVGERTVLFCAEVDAIDDNGNLVEVKVSPKLWETGVIFQMISSRSLKLCKGRSENVPIPAFLRRKSGASKAKKQLASPVEFMSLSEVASEAFRYADVRTLETNIISAMDAIRSQLLDDGVYKLCFLEDGSLSLVSTTDDYNPFPPRDVVRHLID